MTLPGLPGWERAGRWHGESAAVHEAATAVLSRLGRSYWLTVQEEDRPPRELMSALAEAGLLGLGVPEELGGSGGGLPEEAVLLETLGRHGIPLTQAVLNGFVRRVLLDHGTPEHIRRYVLPTATGEVLTSFALTEAESGTNAFAMRTRARADGGGWRVNGQKQFISGVEHASQLCLVARTDDQRSGRAELSVFVLALPHEGISWTRMRTTATLPEHQYVVSFDDAFLPGETLVGGEGLGAQVIFSALNPERILASALAIGLGDHLLLKAVEYARVRAPFGAPIGGYQGVQHPLAKAFTELEAARMVNDEAARAYMRGENVGLFANMAKYLSSEAAYDAYDAVVQTFGGTAFDKDSDVMTFYEYIRLNRVAPLNNQSVLSFVAERALGLPRSH